MLFSTSQKTDSTKITLVFFRQFSEKIKKVSCLHLDAIKEEKGLDQELAREIARPIVRRLL